MLCVDLLHKALQKAIFSVSAMPKIMTLLYVSLLGGENITISISWI